MRLIKHGFKLLLNRFVLGYSTGKALRIFCEDMGIVYIKAAQILSMWNIGSLFTEDDRVDIQSICDSCNPLDMSEIKKTLIQEYHGVPTFLRKIYTKPVGVASVSQVHRAVLKTGQDVVLKIKRNDVSTTVSKDIKTVRELTHIFGPALGFTNDVGARTALNMYYDWIADEIDFEKEVENIQRYKEFADSVNGKVPNCVDIVLPKVYTEYCTKNVIVMEYIPYNTIAQLSDRNESLIRKGIDSYIKMSFWALLNRKPVVFHGDPHLGNIYLDDKGNIGFLDMGLVFELTPRESADTLELFLLAFYGKYDTLYEKLKGSIVGDAEMKERFYAELKTYCKDVPNKPIANYFVDLMLKCFDYNISPPSYLFKMAKAFVYLGGAEQMFTSDMTGYNLLGDQVIAFWCKELKNTVKDGCKDVVTVLDSITSGDSSNAVLSGYTAVSRYNKIIEILKTMFTTLR